MRDHVSKTKMKNTRARHLSLISNLKMHAHVHRLKYTHTVVERDKKTSKEIPGNNEKHLMDTWIGSLRKM